MCPRNKHSATNCCGAAWDETIFTIIHFLQQTTWSSTTNALPAAAIAHHRINMMPLEKNKTRLNHTRDLGKTDNSKTLQIYHQILKNQCFAGVTPVRKPGISEGSQTTAVSVGLRVLVIAQTNHHVLECQRFGCVALICVGFKAVCFS